MIKCSNGAVITIVPQSPSYNRRASVVHLITGEWPSNDELLRLCDEGPGAPFGGEVSTAYEDGRKKRVSVYTD